MLVASPYNIKFSLPDEYVEAVDYLARQNQRSRARELTYRIMNDDAVKAALERVKALEEEMGDFPDIDT